MLAEIWKLRDEGDAAPEGSDEQEELRVKWLDAWRDYQRKTSEDYFGPEC